MSMHPIHVWYLWRSEVCFRFSETGMMDDHEPSCGCWEAKPGPLSAASILNLNHGIARRRKMARLQHLVKPTPSTSLTSPAIKQDMKSKEKKVSLGKPTCLNQALLWRLHLPQVL